MRDERTHPLLAQVPLTVSPFVSLPTATTLPYTYRTMPSTLPVPVTGITGASSSSPSGGVGGTNKPKYIVSPTGGHAAHPDDIISSCNNLKAHLTKLKEDADRELRELETRIRDAELAEKRRVAPGWLDSETHLLQPEKSQAQAAEAEGVPMMSSAAGGGGSAGVFFGTSSSADVSGQFAEMSLAERQGASELDQGAELDRAFAGK
ncbi:uncharacterized protein B0I36DRAFT_361817 [Microdochium trichocladiopsis]|uniref:Uncharacterized protein n=1 Tax=Microdochium trichocladiopsis TaxID=1682393 RepID=A0A9P9BRN1_9PEZI|nr:uncharacterized protein B0I36DRAFT_361817 [Microdochium trichocladiopsis]KAH7033101.1 hypothetical protein B0I36DRAFT_361817 [Microdochium trichocladiopsis]